MKTAGTKPGPELLSEGRRQGGQEPGDKGTGVDLRGPAAWAGGLTMAPAQESARGWAKPLDGSAPCSPSRAPAPQGPGPGPNTQSV